MTAHCSADLRQEQAVPTGDAFDTLEPFCRLGIHASKFSCHFLAPDCAVAFLTARTTRRQRTSGHPSHDVKIQVQSVARSQPLCTLYGADELEARSQLGAFVRCVAGLRKSRLLQRTQYARISAAKDAASLKTWTA
ncbi:hypothetical protein WJX79_003239 [Trebouxia sp. C0005]